MGTMRRALGSLAACGMLCGAVRAQEPSHSVWDGVYTAQQAERGAADYSSHCVACHGENLVGNVADVPALSGKTFLYNWDSLALQALFDRIHTTMPMSNPGSLSAQEALELTAYILSVNRIPAGTSALSSDAQTLQNIRFDAKRPNH